MNALNEVKKKIQKLGYPSHGLKTADGKWILKPNGPRAESNLDQIFNMLDTLPPDNYVVYCTKGRGAGYDYPVPTNGSFGTPMFPPSQTVPQANPDAERLGRLEAENAFLREQLESLKKQLDECDLAEDEDDDIDLADDQEPIPQQSGLMEALAPAVPALVDKALALMDNFINRNKPQQLAEGPKEIDYDQLAEIVVQKIMANQPTQEHDQD